MKKNKKKSPLVAEYIEERVREKRRLGKQSTAELYRAAGNHFLQFLGNGSYRMEEITRTMVLDFGDYLKSAGLRINSINSYMSCLRAIYNAASRDRLIPPSEQSFSGLKLRREDTRKRAVSLHWMELLARMKWHKEDKDLEQAADLALFCFMACGMPFVDVLHLKKENVVGDVLTYHRQKTGIAISIRLTAGMKRILNKYKNHSPYLFPWIGEAGSHSQYKRLLRQYNQALRVIGWRLHIPVRLSSYVFRHTWASTAFRQHIPVSIIGKALGHTSEKTTRIYLEQLDRRELDKANQKVIDSVEKLVCHNH